MDSVSVASIGVLPLSIDVNPISCFDSADGTATVEPINGIAPFVWQWQDGQDTATISNLTGGTYIVTVTDAIGCLDALEFTMLPPDPVEIFIESIDQPCPGRSQRYRLPSNYRWKWNL